MSLNPILCDPKVSMRSPTSVFIPHWLLNPPVYTKATHQSANSFRAALSTFHSVWCWMLAHPWFETGVSLSTNTIFRGFHMTRDAKNAIFCALVTQYCHNTSENCAKNCCPRSHMLRNSSVGWGCRQHFLAEAPPSEGQLYHKGVGGLDSRLGGG